MKFLSIMVVSLVALAPTLVTAADAPAIWHVRYEAPKNPLIEAANEPMHEQRDRIAEQFNVPAEKVGIYIAGKDFGNDERTLSEYARTYDKVVTGTGTELIFTWISAVTVNGKKLSFAEFKDALRGTYNPSVH